MSPSRLALLVTVLAAFGCGAVYRYPESRKEESAAACSNGIDDDLDGKTDCLDPGCASFCAEHDALTCADGKDNDFDGKTDCEDSDCALFCPEQGAAACADGIDNDLDGKKDCEDDGCAEFCHEDTAATCADGIDNDVDGKKDCEDDGCAEFCREDTAETCTDGIDNDLDGKKDCEDDGCADFCREHTTATCSDGIDNDLDGKKDCADPECDRFDFCREDSAAHCKDGLDNDVDGSVDCADSDCNVFAFCREDAADTCADGLDNDLDGKKDCDDPDCDALCGETSAKRCKDGLDNDQDGRVDCDDPSCDGFCSEADPATCSDGRDNDGDGLTDAADPLCWPFTPPVVTRCATLGAQEIDETFDAWTFGGVAPNSSSITTFGGSASFVARSPVLTTRTDPMLVLVNGDVSLDTSSLSGIELSTLVNGSWDGFSLRFSQAVLAGTKLAVGLVPSGAVLPGRNPVVGPESAIVAVTLDGSATPPLLALDVEGRHLTAALSPIPSCGSAYCNDGWGTTSLELGPDGFELSVTTPLESGVKTTTLSAPRPESAQIAPSRLVVWGGGPQGSSLAAELDDLTLRHGALAPCGVSVPQIPDTPPACQPGAPPAFGRTVSVASADGDECALVTVGDATGDPTRVFAYHSVDGSSWQSGEATPSGSSTPAELELPDGVALTGAAVARDDDAGRWLAVVGYRSADGVTLALSSSDDCVVWSSPKAGPLLPSDAEAPSYVRTSDAYQIYFTRPPTDAALRTLWRVSGPAEDALALEPDPLFEIPASVQAVPPFALARIGASDLVLAFPVLSVGGPPGAGMLVSDASASSWQSLPTALLVLPSALGSTFDSDGVQAAALAFRAGRGELVYGGRHSDAQGTNALIETGTALVTAQGGDVPSLPDAPADVCGDGTCGDDETCDSCPTDCDCSALTIVGDAFADASSWQFGNTPNIQPPPGSRQSGGIYLNTDADQAGIIGNFGGGPGISAWAYLPLAEPLAADFELSFELTSQSPESGSMFVGVGADPAQSMVSAGPPWPSASAGLFAGVVQCSDQNGNTAFAAPVVSSSSTSGGQSTEPYGGVACDYGVPGLILPQAEASRRLVLRRERGELSLTVGGSSTPSLLPPSLGSPNACADRVSATSAASGPTLDGIVLAANGVASVKNLRLRRLEDPANCPADETVCGSGASASCVDTSSTFEHCGACFNACSPAEQCVGGECRCPSGQARCDGACVDIESSTTNCGACNAACHAVCANGACVGSNCENPYVLSPAGGMLSFTLDPLNVPDARDAMPCGGQISAETAFSWTPDSSGVASVTLTAGSLTALGVTTAASCASYDSCTADSISNSASLTFSASAGTTYRLVVAHPAYQVVASTLTFYVGK